MTQEEKAKAYDEAIERAKEWFNPEEPDSYTSIVESIFPELKESEDEKIRKVLTDYFKDYKSQEEFGVSTFFGVPTDNILAWLKKQGEQKPTVIIPKFRVGDEIKTPNEESLTITKIDEKGYWSEDLFICRFDDADKWELVEQKDSVVDFKAEDWYVSKVDGKIYNAKFMEQNSCKKTTRRGEIEKAAFSTSGIIEQTDWFIKGAEWADEHPYCNWLEKQGEQKPYGQREECSDCQFNYAGECKGYCELKRNEQKSKRMVSAEAKEAMYSKPTDLEVFINELSKQFPDVSFAKLSRIAVRTAKWAKPTDEEMKELLRTEYEKGRADTIAEMQKSTWSEEDEKRFKSCLNILQAKGLIGVTETINTKWLKSLKERVQLKQEWSEEDECYMTECVNAIATKDGWSFEEKRKMKHWLKSLKERL